MVISHFLKIGLLIALALLLQGCPKGVSITLYNNSQNDLIVLNADKNRVQWRAGSTLRFQSGERWLTIRDEKGRVIPLLAVKEVMKSFDYKLSFYGLPDKYIDHSSGSTIEYNLQFEADRYLYVVKPGDSFPAKHLYSHPIKPDVTPN